MIGGRPIGMNVFLVQAMSSGADIHLNLAVVAVARQESSTDENLVLIPY
jgi:hypothetical protein